jgi:3-dehydroquinate dehydratase / shikimate dehydrogenase
MICLTLMEQSIDKNLKVLEKYQHQVDMIELRLDTLLRPLDISPDKVRSDFNLPVIITFRRKIDGGKFDGPEPFRKKILLAYAKQNFDFIDLEMGEHFPDVEKTVLDSNTKIIRSYHNFSTVPDNLETIIRTLASNSGEIAKVAVSPCNSIETLQLYKIFEKVKDIKNKIILGMGEFGLSSRILYKRVGSLLTFCSSSNNPGAPGQLNPEKMRSLYRAGDIDSRTDIYGIIGNPVKHSHSPEFHNKAYRLAGINAVYIPFPVDELVSFFKLADLLKIKGFSVTIPHKVKVLDYIDEKSSEVLKILSCNTVVKRKNSWIGYNTDMEGFLKPLMSRVNISAIKKCAVIGAGGAARAVIYALKDSGKEVTIFNRSIERAEALALDFNVPFYSLKELELLKDFDLIVQTTSVGMVPLIEKTPLPGYTFKKDQIVYDIVYTPRETRLLRDAKLSGSVTIDGFSMLEAQGKGQFELFTNLPYPQ